jgi:hypothetical protein
MKKEVAKFVIAFGFALSGAVPAFATHTSKPGEAAQHLRAERVHSPGSIDARAYAQDEAPLDARAYAPGDPRIEIGPDFGIGSQR